MPNGHKQSFRLGNGRDPSPAHSSDTDETAYHKEQWAELATQLPQHLTIGTRKAFENNYPFAYEKRQIGSERIYVCTKGSEWARTDEVLVLRCETGIWTAFDSAVSADGTTLQCRQPIFRCSATDVTQAGWHQWQTNYAASSDNAGLAVDWQGALWAETRVP